MKTLFGMTAAVLLVVMMLFVSLPGTAQAAAGKVTLTEMVKIKKAADEAAQAAKAQAEKTDEEKRLTKQLVKQLVKQAEINAEVAGDLLEAVKAGEEVSREEAQACAAIAKAVNKAAGALAAGNMAKAEDVLDRIARMSSNLPTAANARGEMQGADGAVRNQSVTADDMKKMPTAANARVVIEIGNHLCDKANDGEYLSAKQFNVCLENNSLHEMRYSIWYTCKDHHIVKTRDPSLEERGSSTITCKEDEEVLNCKCVKKPQNACTCTGGGLVLGAVKNSAASFVFDRNCVNGQVVEDSCHYPSPSAPNNCPCPAR